MSDTKKPPVEPASSAEDDLANVNRDYPYDPRLLIHEQSGMNKLKAMPDRVLAAQLYRNWQRVEARLKPREMYPEAKAPEQEWWEK